MQHRRGLATLVNFYWPFPEPSDWLVRHLRMGWNGSSVSAATSFFPLHAGADNVAIRSSSACATHSEHYACLGGRDRPDSC